VNAALHFAAEHIGALHFIASVNTTSNAAAFYNHVGFLRLHSLPYPQMEVQGFEPVTWVMYPVKADRDTLRKMVFEAEICLAASPFRVHKTTTSMQLLPNGSKINIDFFNAVAPLGDVANLVCGGMIFRIMKDFTLFLVLGVCKSALTNWMLEAYGIKLNEATGVPFLPFRKHRIRLESLPKAFVAFANTKVGLYPNFVLQATFESSLNQNDLSTYSLLGGSGGSNNHMSTGASAADETQARQGGPSTRRRSGRVAAISSEEADDADSEGKCTGDSPAEPVVTPPPGGVSSKRRRVGAGRTSHVVEVSSDEERDEPQGTRNRLREMKAPKLRIRCKQLGLDTTGNKTEMITRILSAPAKTEEPTAQMQQMKSQMEELKNLLLHQKNVATVAPDQLKSLKTTISNNCRQEVEAGVAAIRSEMQVLMKDPETQGNTDRNGPSSEKQSEYDVVSILQAQYDKDRAERERTGERSSLRAIQIAKQQSEERVSTLNILTASSKFLRPKRLRSESLQSDDVSNVFIKLSAALRVWRVAAKENPPTSFQSATDGVEAEIVKKLGDAHDPSLLESVIQDSLGPEYEKCLSCLDSKFDTVDYGNVDFSKCTDLLDANLRDACISQALSFIGRRKLKD
jgi:hypothetical protein